MRMNKDIKIAIASTVVGIIVGIVTGILISEFFYQRTVKDVKKDLLDGAVMDIIRNMDIESYPQLHDSVKYLKSGQPWRKLSASGIDRLFFSLLSFKNYKSFKEFANLVNEVKLAIDDFNDRISIRNYTIFQGFEYMTPHNPNAFHFYQKEVLPRLITLKEYIRRNYDELVS